MKNSKSNENMKNAKFAAAAAAHQIAEDFDKTGIFDMEDDIFDYVPPAIVPMFRELKTQEQVFSDAGVNASDSDTSAVACRRISNPVHSIRRANRFGRTEVIMSAVTTAVVLCVPFVFTLLASFVSNYAAAIAVCATAMYSMLGVGACGSMVGVIAYTQRGKGWRKQFSIIAGCTVMTAVIAASAIKLIALVASGM